MIQRSHEACPLPDSEMLAQHLTQQAGKYGATATTIRGGQLVANDRIIANRVTLFQPSAAISPWLCKKVRR